jgi:cytoskeletal protein CcmA (bactofilin family)
MGSLSNLYISESYQSLIHLGNDTSASTTLVELQDGVGQGLGISVNTLGDISASNTITTNNLVVNNITELTGVFDLDTYFTASTPAYINSTQPFFTDTVFVTGSYPLGGYPPSIADVQVGWIGNGINVTNGIVTAVSESVSGYYITMAGEFPQIAQSYTFTGQISPTAKITGSLEISENLIISGTFDIEGKVVVNDNVRINGDLEVSGSQRNTGSLFVSNEISSSTINGIGNVTQFSQSLYAEFTNIEIYTSSLRAAFTASGADIIFTNNITASNIEVRNDLNVGGTLFASKVVTLIESASVIFSSGSNILGDEISDIQTLVGSVIISGSGALTGSLGISNDLEVKGNISSSTISGIGNVTSYSESVDSRLDFLEGPFSTSVDSRLDALEDFSSSTFNTFSQSVDSRLDFLEGPFSSSVSQEIVTLQLFTASVGLVTTASFQAFTASTNQRLNSIEIATSSLQSFTSSANVRLNNLESTTASLLIETANLETFSASTLTRLTNIESTTASLNTSVNNLNIASASLNSFSASAKVQLTNIESTTASLNISIANINVATASLQSKTGSYATTGSNTFIGNEVFSGSVRGVVIPIPISSATASMDCSLGNFFTLTLASSATTRLVASNIQPGETVTLRVTQPATTGSLTYPSNIKFSNALAYSASSVSNAVDVITFVSFDTTNLLAASTKNLV